jgi:hypothetical protein
VPEFELNSVTPAIPHYNKSYLYLYLLEKEVN